MAKKPYKGVFVPKNKKKYVGKNIDNIIFRSKLELNFMIWLDNNPNVLEWASESIAIPYWNPVKGDYAHYYPDMWMKYKTSKGIIEEAIIEIKPKDETKLPRQGKGYKKRLATFIINESKWASAKKVCEKRNIKFIVLTDEWIKKNISII